MGELLRDGSRERTYGERWESYRTVPAADFACKAVIRQSITSRYQNHKVQAATGTLCWSKSECQQIQLSPRLSFSVDQISHVCKSSASLHTNTAVHNEVSFLSPPVFRRVASFAQANLLSFNASFIQVTTVIFTPSPGKGPIIPPLSSVTAAARPSFLTDIRFPIPPFIRTFKP